MLSRTLPIFLSLALFLANPTAMAFGEGSAKSAAEVDLKEPMTAKARFQPSSVEAGASAELHLDLTLAEHYHAYLDRLKLTIEKPDDLRLAPFKVSPIVEFYDPASKSRKKGIEGQASLRAVVEVPSGFHPAQNNVKMKFIYQACTSDHCLFPKTIDLDVPLTVTGGPGEPRTSLQLDSDVDIVTYQMKAAPAANQRLEDALQRSLFSAFLLVFVVGFLTCLTPCIYPMIPITLAVLGARSRGQSHWKNFSLALVYVLGIALTYSVLGVVAASTGGFFGAALGNIWVVSAIALMFFAMGLSMFGLFEVQAPAFVRNRLGAARTSRGYGGAFATGLLAGVVASPCIGPVLVSILTFIAQTQSRVLGFFMLFTFAFGMGIPFIALGLSSSALARIPKAGPWMESVKSLFGAVMIAMAFYYIRPLYPVWLFRSLLGCTVVGLGISLGPLAPIPSNQAINKAVLRKGLAVGLVIAGVFIAATGVLMNVLGTNGFLPGSAPVRTASPMAWKPYSQAAFDQAVQKGEPILIDFTAEWCAACQEMEESTFIDPRVVAAGAHFTLFKVDGTEDTPQLHEVIERFKVQGFPSYIFYDQHGKLRTDLTALGYVAADDFLKRMNSSMEVKN